MSDETDARLRDILEATSTIAVVGCSATPGKDAHEVPRFLHEQGYEIVPVNPYAESIFGADAVDTLSEVPEGVNLVNVFRPAEEVPGIVEAALDRADVETVWLQLGIAHEEAARRAEQAGLSVVQDRCIKVEYRRLLG